MPVPLNNTRVEKLDRRVADAHGIGLLFVDILPVDEIFFELICRSV
jgi:hypothetical protein